MSDSNQAANDGTYFIRNRGRILGPFTLDKLKALRDRGQFSRVQEISTDRANWSPASSLDDLFAPGEGPEWSTDPNRTELQIASPMLQGATARFLAETVPQPDLDGIPDSRRANGDLPFSGHRDQPGIAGKVSPEEVQAARDAADRVAQQLENRRGERILIGRQISGIKRRLVLFAAVSAMFRLAMGIRTAFERYSVWRPGALVVAAAVGAALGVVGATIFTNDARVWAASSVLTGIVVSASLGGLVYLPAACFALPRTYELQTSLNQAEIRISEIDKENSQLQQRRATAYQEYCRLKNVFDSRIHRLLTCNWRILRDIPFEEFLGDVFAELGFQVETTKRTGDQGVDLVATRAGFRLAIQAKGYTGSVGNGAVQEVVAGQLFYQCHSCAVITNSEFTSGARELAERTNCRLIDGTQIDDLINGRISFSRDGSGT